MSRKIQYESPTLQMITPSLTANVKSGQDAINIKKNPSEVTAYWEDYDD